MQFFLTRVFLVALTFGAGSSVANLKNVGDDVNNDEAETFFWRTMIRNVDSMPTLAPISSNSTTSPTTTPDGPATVDPTSAPVSPTPAPIIATSAPSNVVPSTVAPSSGATATAPSTVPLSTAPFTSTPTSSSSCQSIEALVCLLPELSTLCELTIAAGLGDALRDDIFTIFAPTNEAFDSIPAEFLEGITDAEILRNVLLYHAVPEMVLSSEDLVCGAEVMMANRDFTTTTCIDNEKYQIGSRNPPSALPKIVAPDGVACNGIIHVVDQVILPGAILTDPPTTTPDDPTPSPVDPTTVDPTPGPTLSSPISDPTTADPTPGPIDPTPVPIDSTSAPNNVEPSSVVPSSGATTTSPTDYPTLGKTSMAPFTSTPTGSSSAPIIPTPDPIDPTPAPIESTLAPIIPTPDPIDPTPAPIESTLVPILPTPDPIVPIDPAPAPIESTLVPILPTPDPIVPIDPTPAPIESTLVPILPTPDPIVPTPAPVDQCQSITEVVCTLPEFEVLCALVGDADLADVLGSNDKFTLFAPINTAFESLSQEILDAVAGDVEFLKNVLLSHAVADEELFSTDLVCDDKVAMANGVETTTICTGDKLFQVGGGNTPDIIPEIVAPDGVACNGVIHAIDHVIFPSGTSPPSPPLGSSYCTFSPDETCYLSGRPACCGDDDTDCPIDRPACELTPAPCQSIAEVVCTLPEFEVLCSLVGDSDLADALGSDDKFTLFAPINTAFESLSSDVAEKATNDIDFLKNILLSHAIANVEVYSTDLVCTEKEEMASGDDTTTICTDDKIYQVGAGNNPTNFPLIIAPDGLGCNGVIHAIDHVILPSGELPPLDDILSSPLTFSDTPDTPVNPDMFLAMRDVINQYHTILIEDESTYQYKALSQTANQIGAEGFSEVQILQYYALYAVYYATNMVPNEITVKYPELELPKWENEEGWNENGRDPCDGWFGIECDSEGRVKNIDLFRNGLTGNFPKEIVLLSFDGPFANGSGKLERLDLTGNEWLSNYNDGSPDSSWMTDLGSIETINVEDTSFSGSIPRLPDGLVTFDISGSFFDDGLNDANFEGLERLNFVDLDYNLFDSTIPSVFGRLPSLEFLYVSGSFITGDLSFMEGMPVLRELWIDNNPLLSGPLYDYIGDIYTLESFSATSGSLTGSIPESFGNLEDMKQMWLYSNLLEGSIPPQLSALKSMETLQVEGNSFSGVMPEEVCANIGDSLAVLGADCEELECSCCTCCGLEECNEQPQPPAIFPTTQPASLYTEVKTKHGIAESVT